MSRIKEPFIPIRRSMLESPGYQLLSTMARRVLIAIEAELLKHGGKDNGQLIVPYKTLKLFCHTSKKSAISQALRELVALGFLIIARGNGGIGKDRAPNLYRLTYMPGHNGGPAGDEWKEIQSAEEALNRMAAAKKPRPQTAWFRAANVIGFPRRVS